MKQIIIIAEPPSVTLPDAVELFHHYKKVICYRIKSDVAILTCLSKGGSRDAQSQKSPFPLYGFIYLNQLNHEAVFVRNTTMDAIRMAAGNGNTLFVADSIEEAINPNHSES